MSADHICRLHKCEASHETLAKTRVRAEMLRGLLRDGLAWDLKPGDVAAVVPPRAPVGCWQNQARGRIVQLLNRKGFTCKGRPIT